MADFESFYNAYYEKAYAYAKKRIQDHHAAEDVVGEAFLYCCSRFDDYDAERASLGTWLYLVLNSRIKNWFRDHKIEVNLEAVYDQVYTDADMLSKAVELQELRTSIVKVLKTLPEIQRLVVICRYFKNMSSKETAAYTGLSEGNVRVQLSRALAKMREYIT